MKQAKLANWHVQEVYPSVKTGTLHTWIKGGVIEPAVPPGGQGFPARYSGENLIEIGIVLQLTRLGFDSHAYLAKLMRNPHGNKKPLIDYIRTMDSHDFLILPGASVFNPELTDAEKDAGPPHFLRTLEQLTKMFGAPLPTGGWVVVDVGYIKREVEIRLEHLS